MSRALLEFLSGSQFVSLDRFLRDPLTLVSGAGCAPVAVLSDDRLGFYVLSAQAMKAWHRLLDANAADEIRLNARQDSFEKLADIWLEQVCARAGRGEITQKTCDVTRHRLVGKVLPFFKSRRPSEVGPHDVDEFLSWLAGQGLGRGTLFQYLLLLRNLLFLAVRHALRKEVPEFPKLTVAHKPRAMLSVLEYRKVVQTAYRLHRQQAMAPEVKRQGGKRARFWIGPKQLFLPRDMAWMVVFMVNSFMRPSDLRNLQHKHVEVVRSGQQVYLRLRLPQSKRHDTPIVSLRPAVRVYEALKKYACAQGQATPDDHVVLPQEPNRHRALALMGFWFAWILREAGVTAHDEHGRERTVYSLRHTAIMYRLMYGQGIDMLTLARNARTSVRMIEHFYASTLSGEMNVGMLQSRRTRKN